MTGLARVGFWIVSAKPTEVLIVDGPTVHATSKNDRLLAILLKIQILKNGFDFETLEDAVCLALGFLDIDHTTRLTRFPAFLQTVAHYFMLMRFRLLDSKKILILVCSYVVPSRRIVNLLIFILKKVDQADV